MAIGQDTPLVVRTHVSAWGFLVALSMGAAFMITGWSLLNSRLLPRHLGIFVEPPDWLPGVLLLVFAMFLFLVGISELARYIRPSTEIVVDNDGISTFGLLGERRARWTDMLAADLTEHSLSIKLRGQGRLPPPDLKLFFGRFDIDPRDVLSRIGMHRPDLLTVI